jgi:hypothetical protein
LNSLLSKSSKLLPFSLIALAWFFFLLSRPAAAQDGNEDWQRNWGVVEGFVIEVDTEGYELPSALAFVPQPGSDPQDPLYFVTELRGTIKVVTNDRSVHIFAESFFENNPQVGFEKAADEYGLAGICLAPEQGYVFVTYTYFRDSKLYNAIARFETESYKFAIVPSGVIYFTEPFRDFPTRASHQIGGCQVNDGFLYVGVGDGLHNYQLPQSLDTPLGKILRMTLDGNPVPDNPYYQNQDPKFAANYIWAYGFRNPFGLKLIDEGLFLAENGVGLDRFIEINRGTDYLWDGSDYSIGSRNIATFFPSIGPAQMDYVPRTFEAFPTGYRNVFYVAMSAPTRPGILAVRLDFTTSQLETVPELFLTYNGELDEYGTGVIAALALGSDGLYFAPIAPSGREEAAVYRVTYDTGSPHPFLPGGNSSSQAIIYNYGCLGCHTLNGEGGDRGPILDYAQLQPGLRDRLNSQAYLDALDRVDQLDEEPFISYLDERQQIRELNGLERQKAWIIYHLLEPKFDDPTATMPNLGLTRRQAEIVASFLLRLDTAIPAPDQSVQPQSESTSSSSESASVTEVGLPPARYRYVLVALILGIGLGVFISHLRTMEFLRRSKK